MKGTYRGLMTVDEFFQALFQDKTFFTEQGITHIRSASLYFTPCDASGRSVIVVDQNGGKVDGYETAGCYHSVADHYQAAGDLEPKSLCRKTNGSGRVGRQRDKRTYKPT